MKEALFSNLPTIMDGEVMCMPTDGAVQNWHFDSRKVNQPANTLFFALKGNVNDGHDYIAPLYKNGVRKFVIERALDVSPFPEAAFIKVPCAIAAMQALARYHRDQFNYPVLAITGSNGKTMVKEWLDQLLSPDYKTVISPGSYNSQVGVPLSVWQMQEFHELGIFEAGISLPGEMEKLASVINPTLGIFTNLGSAHDEGFGSRREKLLEKMKLFADVKKLIYCTDHALAHEVVTEMNIPSFTWGFEKNADIQYRLEGKKLLVAGHTSLEVELPFYTGGTIENLCHCITTMLYLGMDTQAIIDRVAHLKAVPMRLELKDALNHSQLIDDTYNNDLGGLQLSLNFLSRQHYPTKTVILSDILQTGLPEPLLLKSISDMVSDRGIQKLIGIGPVLKKHEEELGNIIPEVFCYATADSFLAAIPSHTFREELILVKGARHFQFERIVQCLQRKAHRTVLEIDFDKLTHNLQYFKSKLQPGVKMMVMVKALAYGSGSEEVASLLEYHGVDYLGVAYADEGMELRKKHIDVPIMVMNTEPDQITSLFAYNLEPVVYSTRILRLLAALSQGRPVNVHIELETGMQRLGFEETEIDEVIRILQSNTNINVASVFSHLAGADDPLHDTFTDGQYERYEASYQKLCNALSIKSLKHLLNSNGILRKPNYQMDMVRLGIGLYGITSSGETTTLQAAISLKTVVSQIKRLKKGDSVGYGRQHVARQDMTIATIAIGYADGFSRAYSQGKGKVLIHGQYAPVVGNVCMDMTMVDVTGIVLREGDEVTVFGPGLSIEEVAQTIGTIPYEILTNTGYRVKRVYHTRAL